MLTLRLLKSDVLKPGARGHKHRTPFHAAVVSGWLLLGLLLGSGATGATEDPGASGASGAGTESVLPDSESVIPDSVRTFHSLALADGRSLEYAATVGYLRLGADPGQPTARVFTVSFEATDTPARPVTFLFNGGPGAASAYLNVGGLGPRILEADAAGLPTTTPPRLIENRESWLAFTDLVFVDPPGTGFSRVMAGESGDFWYRGRDLAAMEEAFGRWLDTHGRRGDPVFIGGESYGGYRAAALPARLMQRSGISVALSGRTHVLHAGRQQPHALRRCPPLLSACGVFGMTRSHPPRAVRGGVIYRAG